GRGRLSTGRHFQGDRLIQGRHFDGRSQHCLRHRHAHRRGHVTAATAEPGVGADVHVHKEIAGGTAVATGAALALNPNTLPVDDAGRNSNVYLTRRWFTAGPVTGFTGRLDSSTATLADGTDTRHGEGTLVIVDGAATLAPLAGHETGARFSAVAATGVAGVVARKADGRGDAHHGVAEAEMQGSFEIGAPLGPIATSAAKEPAEDIAQIA